MIELQTSCFSLDLETGTALIMSIITITTLARFFIPILHDGGLVEILNLIVAIISIAATIIFICCARPKEYRWAVNTIVVILLVRIPLDLLIGIIIMIRMDLDMDYLIAGIVIVILVTAVNIYFFLVAYSWAQEIEDYDF